MLRAVSARKHQRLDHHRHRAGGVQHRADVDVVELLQLQPVDRHDRVGDLHLLAQVNADQAADVAVAGENERMVAREAVAQALDHAAAERIEPLERRRALPRHEQRDRRLAAGEIEPLEHGLDRARDRGRIDGLAVERQRRRDHRHVAQRQRVERRNVDRAAAELDGVLRRADHGGADAFERLLRDCGQNVSTRARISAASSGPRSPNFLLSLP